VFLETSQTKHKQHKNAMAPSRKAKAKVQMNRAVLYVYTRTKISKLVASSPTAKTVLATVVPAALVALEAARYIQRLSTRESKSLRLTKTLAKEKWLTDVNNLREDIQKLPQTSFTEDSRRQVRSFQIGGTQAQNAHSGSPLVTTPQIDADTRTGIDLLWTPRGSILRRVSATMARVAKTYMPDGARVNAKHIAQNEGRDLCASKVFQRLQVTMGTATAHKDHQDIHNGCCITMPMHAVDATTNKSHSSQLHVWDESGTRHKLRIQTGDMVIFRSKQVKHCVRCRTKERCSIVGYTKKRVSPLGFEA
jgi:hypothetical protein